MPPMPRTEAVAMSFPNRPKCVGYAERYDPEHPHFFSSGVPFFPSLRRALAVRHRNINVAEARSTNADPQRYPR